MIRLAFVGTGGMADHQAGQFRQIRGVQIVACCDVDEARARAFAAKFGIPHVYTDFEKMLAQCEIDAVTNVTPDRFHAPLSLQALEAGKHIFCEKPLATRYADAARLAEAAARAGVIHMVNFSYRNSAALQAVAARVRRGDIGRVFHVEAHYLQSWLTAKDWGDWRMTPAWLWRLSTRHGSLGVLGDIGVHILDFASFPVGDITSVQCLLKTFDKAPGGRVGEYTLDANDTAIITVVYAGGAVGAVQTTRLATGHLNSLWLSIHGEYGAFRVDLDRSYREYEFCKLRKDGRNGPWRTVRAPATPTNYVRFIRSIRTGGNDQPDFARGAQIQAVLDACVRSNRSGKSVSVAASSTEAS